MANLLQLIRRTTQIWVAMHHQCGISVPVSQTSFGGKTSRGVAKCHLSLLTKGFFLGLPRSLAKESPDTMPFWKHYTVLSLKLTFYTVNSIVWGLWRGIGWVWGEGNKCLEDKKRSRVTNWESFDFICIEPIDQCVFWILDIQQLAQICGFC